MDTTQMNNANDNNAFRGLLFPVDGPAAPVAIRSDRVLEDLYRAMRCSMVEIVVLTSGVDLWCDEEALLKQPIQPNRCWLARHCATVIERPLCGDVVALGRTDDGNTRSLTVDEADEVFSRIVAANRELAVQGDPQPAHAAVAKWLREGIDWRQ
jgi:hypothetical protein